MSKLNTALEWVLSEKTAELMLHNRTAAFSRNILQALPAAVLCINSDDVIILCNDACRQLLENAAMSLVGRERRGSLSAELNGFIDIVRERREHGVSLVMNGRTIGARGKRAAFAENEDGIVVVLGGKDVMDRVAI
jgi:nitrogen fixation/metabolism regulation signal transduction histidine kinase